LESDPIESELIVINITDTDVRLAFSAFDSTGRFLGSQPQGVGAFNEARARRLT
jgi:hypothetical protein